MRTIALCAVLLGLAPLSLGEADAQSAPLCDTLARSLSAFAPPDDPRGPWQSALRALGGAVGVDWEGRSPGTREALLDTLAGYRATPGLREALERQWTSASRPTLHSFGRSSLHLSQTIQGTAYCQRFVFFDSAAPGHVIDPPPIAATGDETAFCWQRQGHAGEVAGVPAFIVESDRDNTVELTVSPWRDGHWDKACRVVVRFENAFTASERFCRSDVDCNAIAERARGLVEELDRRSDPRTAIRDTGPLTADAGLDDQLPTFGARVKDPYRFSYTQFFSDTIFLPVSVGGQIYLGRLGHAGFAWRKSRDYLFAAYRMTGDRLEPVAGIYVIKTRARAADIKVD